MQELLREYLNEIGSKQKKRRRFSVVAAVFAVAVVGTVIWGLARAGIATTGDVKCGLEEHTHTEECYTSTLACGQEESEGHTHTEACYQTVSNLVCGQEESEEHTHTEACYQTESVLACGQEEHPGHTHSDACYAKNLTCGLEEHAHTEGCYIDTNADVEDAAAWAAQYESVEWKEVWGEDLVIAAELQLDYKESVENYIVAEDGSHKGYTRYGQFADERYIDWDASFVNFCMYYAGLTSSEMFPKEKTTQEWYDKFVQADEGKNKVYLTAPEGYEPEAGDIIFLKNENKETDFQMGIVSSYDKDKNEIKVIEGNSDNKVQENTYDIADTHISEYLKIGEMEKAYKNPDSETEEEPETDASEPSFVTEAEETPEEKADEQEETSAETIEKVYTSDDFIVTASYAAEANIPEEAELIAEKITPEADEAHYAEREAEFKEMAKNEDAVMKALLKIGFYVDGAEVEPESTVTITVQFLDEQGLAEGKPITIVHFADGGTEVLDGSKASDNSTTFQTESFSEFAIGDGMEGAEVGESRPIDKTFEYEDEVFRINFHVTGNAMMTDEKMPKDMEEATDAETVVGEEGEEIAKKYQFKVKVLEEESEEHQAFLEYTSDKDEGSEQIVLQTMRYALYYENMKLDLTECKVTGEIIPKTTIINNYVSEDTQSKDVETDDSQSEEGDDSQIEEEIEPAASILGQAKGSSRNLLGRTSIDGEILQEDTAGADVVGKTYLLSVFERTSNGDINKSGTIAMDEEEIAGDRTRIETDIEADTFATEIEGKGNVPFTVEYYAYIDQFSNSESANVKNQTASEIKIIDTPNGTLPENGKAPSGESSIWVKRLVGSSENGEVIYDRTLEPIYSSKDFTYYAAPSINYFNKLLDNEHYELIEVWTKASEETRWKRYKYTKKLHFTNCDEAENIIYATPTDEKDVPQDINGSGYVMIDEDITIRLVYNMTEDSATGGAAFYDYDISNGMNSDNKLITGQKGINDPSNYSGSGAKYGFGNGNTGSGLQLEMWDGNLLNRRNETKNSSWSIYQMATFGMVTGMNADRTNVSFGGGINGPDNLFGNGDAVGKENYGGKLTFNRKGDTYTLSAVTVRDGETDVGGVDNLHKFGHPGVYNGTNNKKLIWSNNFWPMDNVPTSKRKDPNFGGDNNPQFSGEGGQLQFEGTQINALANGTVPGCDDGQNHNSYFGMSYEVEFELDESYVGPLEYCFFGDDDMWVFLSPLDADARNSLQSSVLVCDIGGVHSSIGEKVNLWDHLNKGTSKGKYALNFFYTERGASGSSCWMQFTLPSVSLKDTWINQSDYGNLKVEKAVEKIENGISEKYNSQDEFTFEIKLQDVNGNALPDHYSYIKYAKQEDGSLAPNPAQLVLRNGSIFTLKNGEYIVIQHIDKDAKYVVTEKSGAVKISDINYACSTDTERKDGVNGELIAVETEKKQDNLVVEGKIYDQHRESQVKFTNKFTVYHLPATGGQGIYLYMFGGVLIISAASLMTYRKKRKGVLGS